MPLGVAAALELASDEGSSDDRHVQSGKRRWANEEAERKQLAQRREHSASDAGSATEGADKAVRADGYAVHTGGDAWSAAVGKPQRVPPVASTPTGAVEDGKGQSALAASSPSPCLGCSNCVFARAAGGLCAGGGHPAAPNKRQRLAGESRAAPPRGSNKTARTARCGGDRVQHVAGQQQAGAVLPAADEGRAALADVADLPRHLRERTRVFKPGSSTDRPSHHTTSGSDLSPLAVIYWARKVLRGHENPALDVAICAANRSRRPLLVLIEVEDRYPYATARRQHFVLDGVVPILLR